MLKVGLTGSIAVGKSFVREVLIEIRSPAAFRSSMIGFGRRVSTFFRRDTVDISGAPAKIRAALFGARHEKTLCYNRLKERD